MNENELRELINEIYNIIATNSTYETRTEIDKTIIELINKLYIKER